MSHGIYIKIPGITGNAPKEYAGYIEASTFSWGNGSASIRLGDVGPGGGRVGSLDDAAFSKSFDSSSHALYEAAVTDKVFEKVIVLFVSKTGRLKCTLTQVQIKDHSISDDGDKAVELIKLHSKSRDWGA